MNRDRVTIHRIPFWDVAAPYEAMADLIGVVHGGRRGRSTDAELRFPEVLERRRSRK
jgi:hypothetical protein